MVALIRVCLSATLILCCKVLHDFKIFSWELNCELRTFEPSLLGRMQNPAATSLLHSFLFSEAPCFHFQAIISPSCASATSSIPFFFFFFPPHILSHTILCLSCADMADLLRLLLRVAEKAANVARICRQEAPPFQLLVQEKTGEDKNKKFVQDFKTLADVVIQEMIRHDVRAQVGEGVNGEP